MAGLLEDRDAHPAPALGLLQVEDLGHRGGEVILDHGFRNLVVPPDSFAPDDERGLCLVDTLMKSLLSYKTVK